MKLEVGAKMFDFTYDTPWIEGKNFYQESLGSVSCLFFLRYYGCSVCQLNVRELVAAYPAFEKRGVKLFIVLQSAPETLQEQCTPDYFPFDVICDPGMELYRLAEIGDNPSKGPEDFSERLCGEIAQARSLGIQHGKYEGNEAQAPATVVMNPDGRIIYSWYGVEASDVPTAEEMLSWIDSEIQ